MADDVRKFFHRFLHCLFGSSVEIIPRPLATAINGSMPNEVVHAHVLYMETGVNGNKYALILKEDLSGYIWLYGTPESSAR